MNSKKKQEAHRERNAEKSKGIHPCKGRFRKNFLASTSDPFALLVDKATNGNADDKKAAMHALSEHAEKSKNISSLYCDLLNAVSGDPLIRKIISQDISRRSKKELGALEHIPDDGIRTELVKCIADTGRAELFNALRKIARTCSHPVGAWQAPKLANKENAGEIASFIKQEINKAPHLKDKIEMNAGKEFENKGISSHAVFQKIQNQNSAQSANRNQVEKIESPYQNILSAQETRIKADLNRFVQTKEAIFKNQGFSSTNQEIVFVPYIAEEVKPNPAECEKPEDKPPFGMKIRIDNRTGPGDPASVSQTKAPTRDLPKLQNQKIKQQKVKIRNLKVTETAKDQNEIENITAILQKLKTQKSKSHLMTIISQERKKPGSVKIQKDKKAEFQKMQVKKKAKFSKAPVVYVKLNKELKLKTKKHRQIGNKMTKNIKFLVSNVIEERSERNYITKIKTKKPKRIKERKIAMRINIQKPNSKAQTRKKLQTNNAPGKKPESGKKKNPRKLETKKHNQKKTENKKRKLTRKCKVDAEKRKKKSRKIVEMLLMEKKAGKRLILRLPPK